MTTENLKKYREFFHTIPEPGWQEYETTINIIKILKEMGYDVKYGRSVHSESRMGLPKEDKVPRHKNLSKDYPFDVSEILEGYTGCVAELDTEKEGPTIGMRFDIDALEIKELEDDNHLPYKNGFLSENKGFMHACGHDGHISIGLNICKYLMDHKDSLRGKFVVIFQPAEEGVRGGRSMSAAYPLDNIDYFLGMHLGINQPSGKIAIGSENIFATSKLDITFKGLSSHAGLRPEEGNNALLGGVTCALNLHTLTQTSQGMSRLNVGTINAGTSRNVIADFASLQIEVRGENDQIVDYLKKRTEEITKGSALSYNLEYEIEEVGGAPSLLTYDLDFYEELSKFLETKGYDVVRYNLFNASEDVTYFMNKVIENGGKAVHILVGSDLKAGHHNQAFDFNDKDLEVSYNLYIDLINHLINEEI